MSFSGELISTYTVVLDLRHAPMSVCFLVWERKEGRKKKKGKKEEINSNN